MLCFYPVLSGHSVHTPSIRIETLLNFGTKANKDGTKRLKSGLYTSAFQGHVPYFVHDMCQISTAFVVTINKCCLSVQSG